MLARICSRLATAVAVLACVSLVHGQSAPAGHNTHVPQTALSLCPSLRITARELVPVGTAIAVSPDGRYLVEYIHTTRGADLKIRDRDTHEERSLHLEPPLLPPGTFWQIKEILFSPSGDTFAVRSIGSIWVVSSETAEVRYRIPADAEKQIYPGKASLARDRLAVTFWPVESYLSDVSAKKPVEVRVYDSADGVVLHSFALALGSSDQWTEVRLSSDASRLAVLLRPTRWPGKARLKMFDSEQVKLLWEEKIGAEDLSWSADTREMIVLGNQLSWLDAKTGKKRRSARKAIHFSEMQRLRTSEAGNLAVGYFARYNPLKRTLYRNDRRDTRMLVWQMDTGKALCEIAPRPAEGADVWPTARGELIALEESFELRASLRLLSGATIVTYHVERPSAAAPAGQ